MLFAETWPEDKIEGYSQNGIAYIEVNETTSKDDDSHGHLTHLDPQLFQRKVIKHLSADQLNDESSAVFTVTSYNVLASCHVDPAPADCSDIHRYSHSQVFRHNCLMRELEYLDCDIICLQEVLDSYYQDILKDAMESRGYTGSFKCRLSSLKPEGCATFFRSSRFSLIKYDWISLTTSAAMTIRENEVSRVDGIKLREYFQRPDVILIHQLRCKVTNQILVVGNVHVIYNLKCPDIQALQVARAFHEVDKISNNGSIAYILCGDFNQAPGTPGYHLACDGFLKSDMINYLQKCLPQEFGIKAPLVDLLSNSYHHSLASSKSAYLVVQGSEPSYTCMPGDECLDYIFFSSSTLQIHDVLEIPSYDASLLSKIPAPSLRFHSDHFALKATLSF